jgi:DNA-directed RNA polymerase subunit RPC12/RpoP
MATSHTCSECNQTYNSDSMGTGANCPYCAIKAFLGDEDFNNRYN